MIYTSNYEIEKKTTNIRLHNSDFFALRAQSDLEQYDATVDIFKTIDIKKRVICTLNAIVQSNVGGLFITLTSSPEKSKNLTPWTKYMYYFIYAELYLQRDTLVNFQSNIPLTNSWMISWCGI